MNNELDLEAHFKHARALLKKLKDEYGSYRTLFQKVYGYNPSKHDLQRFTNYFNRGDLKLEFIIQVIHACDAYHITFNEFFKGDSNHSKTEQS